MKQFGKRKNQLVFHGITFALGPTTPVDSSISAVDLFCRFFWYDTSIEEIKAFVGILTQMGIVKLPRIEFYWSLSHPYLVTPGISNAMSRVRFEQIFRFLHLCNNKAQVSRGRPGYDRLFKVRKFFDLSTAQFESEYALHQQCSIDEAMIPY